MHQKNPISLNPSSCENLTHDNVKEGTFSYDFFNYGVDETTRVKEPKLKPLSESVLSSKLENWIDQYKKDVDYWGIGSGPIFTVFEDSEGNVKNVLVNEDEILNRSHDWNKVNSRIIYAKGLAREMESGENVIPRNSSVAKFVVSGEESGFIDNIRGVILRPDFIPKLSTVGSLVFCGLVVFWVARKLISSKKEVCYTQLEKEMMRRKIKSRKEKEMLEKGSVELIQKVPEPPVVTFERPKIDKEELMKNIRKAKAEDKLALVDSSSSQTSISTDFDDKIQEIRKMARTAREIEVGVLSQVDNDEEEEEHGVDDELSDETEMSFLNNLSYGVSEQGKGTDETLVTTVSVEAKSEDAEFSSRVASSSNEIVQASSASNVDVSRDCSRKNQDSESTLCLAVTKDAFQSSDPLHSELCLSETNSIKSKPRIIRSVKEAREFLSKKRNKPDIHEPLVKTLRDDGSVSRQPSNIDSDKNISQVLDVDNFEATIFSGTSESKPSPDAYENSTLKHEEYVPAKKHDPDYADEVDGGEDCQMSSISSDHEDIGEGTKMGPSVKIDNWVEKNFHEIEPMVKKIGVGFRDNFKAARDKVNHQLDTCADITQLVSGKDDSEFEWMNDDRLREIVFQVRDNELAGHDPFYMMDAEDKLAFFQGLEKKVEKENEKLLQLHEYLHSNIENLNYGAGTSLLYSYVK